MYYDKDFLRELDLHRSKVIHARIIALQLDETPIETIEGRVTQGSINIDGDSAVRRTCSLTMVAENFDYSAFIWGLNTKFKLEIGVENTINSDYPDIIWFKQGTYFISSFNTAHATNNFTIQLQGKDKMCMLNGELGGALTSSVDFGTVEDIITIDGEKQTKITKLTLKEIIRNAVHLYGGEPLHNIIINDLDMSGLELLEYRYSEDTPLYLYRDARKGTMFDNVTLDKDKDCSVEGKPHIKKFKDLTAEELELLVSPMIGKKEPAIVVIEGKNYYVAKVSYGETAGYRYTELTYAGDLIGNVGESITSILDKIKNMLGDFEYFYDLDGQFIFQRKRYSFDSSWSPLKENEDGQQIIDFDNNIAYTFSDSTLVTTFNNNPNITNLKNDYSIWGNRQSLSGASIPVHMRYAIDQKPTYYKTLGGDIFTSDKYDWRELIYQMAKDYYANTNNDDFESQLAAANVEYYSTGKTGYENYYQDILGFWRDLYDAEIIVVYNENLEIQKSLNEWEEELLEKPNKIALKAKIKTAKKILEKNEEILAQKEGYYTNGPRIGWNEIVYLAPQNLNFWFDFLDTEGELSNYSVRNIGCRQKAINDSNVKAIYFRETPDILFTSGEIGDEAYTYIKIPPSLMNTMFSISAQGKSAKGAMDELLYKHSYCIASTTINTIPIYYLEANSRIHIVDEKTKLNGYYNVSKLSIPLNYNGTMSITATKAAENV